MVLKDGPLKSAFERNTKGVVKQEFITYVVKNNQLVKESVVRKFSPGKKINLTLNQNQR